MNNTMTNIVEPIIKKSIAVHIDGDKTAFISKNSLEKFKQTIKSNSSFKLSELVEKYVKPEYNLEIISTYNNEFKYKIVVKSIQKSKTEKTETTEKTEKTETEKKHELLKAKLNLMANSRTNSDYYKAKSSGNVDDNILDEYQKLKKITKMAIPEPSEILKNPEEYKHMISMILSNSIMKQYGNTHPYVRYFKLLAEKIGATEILPIPTQNFDSLQNTVPNYINNISKPTKYTELKQVSGININNDDTESETDDIII